MLILVLMCRRILRDIALLKRILVLLVILPKIAVGDTLRRNCCCVASTLAYNPSSSSLILCLILLMVVSLAIQLSSMTYIPGLVYFGKASQATLIPKV